MDKNRASFIENIFVFKPKLFYTTTSASYTCISYYVLKICESSFSNYNSWYCKRVYFCVLIIRHYFKNHLHNYVFCDIHILHKLHIEELILNNKLTNLAPWLQQYIWVIGSMNKESFWLSWPLWSGRGKTKNKNRTLMTNSLFLLLLFSVNVRY